MTIEIRELELAKCGQRHLLAKGENVSKWISEALPENWKIYSFHYFVKWDDALIPVDDRAWLTKLVYGTEGGERDQLLDADVAAYVAGSSVEHEYLALSRVLSKYGMELSLILLPEPMFEPDSSRIWVGVEGNGGMRIKSRPASDLRAAIQRHSGGAVNVGRKGLIYGTSAAECALSHTDYAYPGDVDCIVVDANERIVGVVEYKKHTLTSKIEDHMINEYYPRSDYRKYKRLFSLVKRFSEVNDIRVKFFMLYYSTKSPIARIQEISHLNNDSAEVIWDSLDIDISYLYPSVVGRKIIERIYEAAL